MRWWRLTDRKRKHWFALFPIVAVSFWAVVLMNLLLDDNTQAMASVITAALVVQLVSPYDPPPAALPKRLRYRVA